MEIGQQQLIISALLFEKLLIGSFVLFAAVGWYCRGLSGGSFLCKEKVAVG